MGRALRGDVERAGRGAGPSVDLGRAGSPSTGSSRSSRPATSAARSSPFRPPRTSTITASSPRRSFPAASIRRSPSARAVCDHDRRAAGDCRYLLRRVLRTRRRTLGQRDRSARAQQRALLARCDLDQSVRTARAGHLRAPAGRAASISAGRDGQHPRQRRRRHAGRPRRPLREPLLKLHLYGKAHAALRRKMGHFTVLGDTIDEALTKAERGRRELHWIDDRAAALR